MGFFRSARRINRSGWIHPDVHGFAGQPRYMPYSWMYGYGRDFKEFGSVFIVMRSAKAFSFDTTFAKGIVA
jgi:hypothetical protein